MKEPTDAESSILRRDTAPRAAIRRCFYHWFTELEALGEDTTFRLGSVRSGQAEPSWTRLPHHTFDGLGGLYHVIEQRRGLALELPVLRGPFPDLPERCLAALRVLATPRRVLVPFKREAPRPDARASSAWALFTRDETTELRCLARNQGTSLNALFLAALTAAIRPLLVDGPGLVNWVVPVNMRGVESRLAPTENQAATLDVAFPVGASAAEIDAELREQRRRNAHWGVWQLLKCLGVAGPAVIQFVARRELGVRKHGSFSNLGDLRLRGDDADQPKVSEWWMAMNPVQQARPLGAACVSYYGRLALTLQIHPALGLERDAAQDVLSAWIQALYLPARAETRSTIGTTTVLPGAGGVKVT